LRPIWVGDIGGTNARIELLERLDGAFSTICEERLPSREYESLGDLLDHFAERHPEAGDARRAGFAIAAPIHGDVCQATNLPWRIHRRKLQDRLGLDSLRLLNDLEGAARGLPLIEAASLRKLQEGSFERGTKALAFAGTGLGEAGLISIDEGWQPLASEGGHSSFSPRNELEVELWRFVAAETGHVSWERILSGEGLCRIFRFLLQRSAIRPPAWFEEGLAIGNGPPSICRAGLAGESETARAALELFSSLYGCEAANLALKLRADGGVFLGGGLAQAMLQILEGPQFLEAFHDKGRYRSYLERLEVSVVLDQRIALLGAANAVCENDIP